MGTALMRVMRAVLVSVVAVLSQAFAEEIKGHLRPLGSHAPPVAEIDVIESGLFPSPLEFYDEYIVKARPVLLRGAAKQLKAWKLWNDEYMTKAHGKDYVEVEEGKKENRDLGMWSETLGDFLRKYQGKDANDKYQGNFYSVS